MRTQDEILARVQADRGVFGFAGEVLILFLDFEHAKPFLKDEVTAADWKPEPVDRETILGQMREYMAFAWGKVEDHRGISAHRSVEKMAAWTWLLGDEKVLADFKAADYENYGAPKLAVICHAYDFPIPDSEEIQRMSEGLPCGAGDCGCGS